MWHLRDVTHSPPLLAMPHHRDPVKLMYILFTAGKNYDAFVLTWYKNMHEKLKKEQNDACEHHKKAPRLSSMG